MRVIKPKARPANTVSLLPASVPKLVRTPAVLPARAADPNWAAVMASLAVNPPTFTLPKPNKFCTSVLPASAVIAPRPFPASTACPTRNAVLTFCIPGTNPVAPIAACVQLPVLAASATLIAARICPAPGIKDRPIFNRSRSLKVLFWRRSNTAPSDLRMKSMYPGMLELCQLAYS